MSDSEDDERGGTVGGDSENNANGSSTEVVVDEQLFEEGFDDIDDTETLEEGATLSGQPGKDQQEEAVVVDEALFEGENLEALNLEDDDSSNLALPSQDVMS